MSPMWPLVYQFSFTFQEKERIRLEFTHDELYKFYNQVNKKEAFFFLTVQKNKLLSINKNQRIGVIKRNKQPTTDLCDRMVILSTSFGHNNDLFQDTELKKIFTEILKNGS